MGLSQVAVFVSTPGEDFAVVQQEIIMMKDCKHSNIVAYFGSYLRWVCLIRAPITDHFTGTLHMCLSEKRCLNEGVTGRWRCVRWLLWLKTGLCAGEISCGSVWSTVEEVLCRISIMVMTVKHCFLIVNYFEFFSFGWISFNFWPLLSPSDRAFVRVPDSIYVTRDAAGNRTHTHTFLILHVGERLQGKHSHHFIQQMKIQV